MSFNFNGHSVDSVHEGVFAVISHHVNPVIGTIRTDDRDGKPYSYERLLEAYSHAATDILAELQRLEDERLEERARRRDSETEEWLERTREAMLAASDEDLNDEPEAW